MTARDVTIEQHDLYTLFPSTASYFPADEDEFSSVSNHWGNWSHPTNDVLFPNSTQTPAVGLPDGVRWDATPDPSQNSVACIPESFTPGSVANNSGSLDKDNAPKPTGLIPELTAQPESLHSVSTGPNEPQRTRRRQPRISSSAKKILERFFTDSPYPLAREIEGLTVSTGLEFKKIRNWFNNTRARRVSPCQDSNGNRAVGDVHQETKQEQDGEVRNPNSHRVSSSYELHELTKENEQLCRNTRDHEENFPTYSSRDHTGSCGTPISCRSLEELSKETQGSQKPPLEAWVSSPLQSEPVAIAAIRAASMSTSDAGTSSDHYLDSPSFQLQSRAPSVISSFASSASSITSQSTNLSTPSRYSRTSIGASRIRRRGRKRMHATFELNPTSRNRKQILNKGGSHFCTFCYKRLRGYYEWVRHEESIHVPRDTWICCSGVDCSNGLCPFCNQSSPDQGYCQSHRYGDCSQKSVEDRTFFRKDQFIQHLHLCHLTTRKHPEPMNGCGTDSTFGCGVLVEAWRRPAAPLAVDDPALYCGFCEIHLPDWAERCEHISQHFKKDKKSMSQWLPGRSSNINPYLANEQKTPHLIATKRCIYCQKSFTAEDQSHSTCLIWSCEILHRQAGLSSLVNEPSDDAGEYDWLVSFITQLKGCKHFCSSFMDFKKHFKQDHSIDFFEFSRKLPHKDQCMTSLRCSEYKDSVFEAIIDATMETKSIDGLLDAENANLAGTLSTSHDLLASQVCEGESMDIDLDGSYTPFEFEPPNLAGGPGQDRLEEEKSFSYGKDDLSFLEEDSGTRQLACFLQM